MENKKDKKLPFAVLRKGAIAGVLGLTMGLSCFCLTGCSDGKDGANGKDGENGLNGLNGTNIYVGYDGYIWQDDVRTTFKLSQDEEAIEGVVEDTIGAYTTMKYWAGEYVDLSTNVVALMSNFKPNAKLTQYSGTEVTELQIVSENAGTLYIGTAKVEDVITSRTTGATLTATTTEYTLTAGINTITLDLTIGEDETIVLGGSGSTAKVYVVKNLPVADEEGNYALVDSTSNTDVISKTNNYADTLAVRVKARLQETAIFSTITTTYPAGGEYKEVSLTGAPYRYTNNSKFVGRTITKIGALVMKNNAGSAKPYMTVYKCKVGQNSNFNNGTAYKIYFPEGTQVNTWAYADCHIELADDETIAFGASSGDTLVWGYKGSDGSSDYYFTNNQDGQNVKMQLLFDVYATNSWESHLAEIEATEQELLVRGYL